MAGMKEVGKALPIDPTPGVRSTLGQPMISPSKSFARTGGMQGVGLAYARNPGLEVTALRDQLASVKANLESLKDAQTWQKVLWGKPLNVSDDVIKGAADHAGVLSGQIAELQAYIDKIFPPQGK